MTAIPLIVHSCLWKAKYPAKIEYFDIYITKHLPKIISKFIFIMLFDLKFEFENGTTKYVILSEIHVLIWLYRPKKKKIPCFFEHLWEFLFIMMYLNTSDHFFGKP